jgi:hypothetical protein
MISKQWITEDANGSCGPIQGISRYLLGGTEEYHNKPAKVAGLQADT